jgi:hypothetical protein
MLTNPAFRGHAARSGPLPRGCPDHLAQAAAELQAPPPLRGDGFRQARRAARGPSYGRRDMDATSARPGRPVRRSLSCYHRHKGEPAPLLLRGSARPSWPAAALGATWGRRTGAGREPGPAAGRGTLALQARAMLGGSIALPTACYGRIGNVARWRAAVTIAVRPWHVSGARAGAVPAGGRRGAPRGVACSTRRARHRHAGALWCQVMLAVSCGSGAAVPEPASPADPRTAAADRLALVAGTVAGEIRRRTGIGSLDAAVARLKRRRACWPPAGPPSPRGHGADCPRSPRRVRLRSRRQPVPSLEPSIPAT